MKLSAAQCRTAKPRDKAYKLTDGNGLYLEVIPSGKKYWRWQYSWQGKRPRLSFGAFPEVTLNDAREMRDAGRKQIRNGVNPARVRRQEKLRQRISAENTFEKLAREWHTNNIEQWTPNHAADILRRFERDIFADIGGIPITDLETPDILASIRKIESRGARELASRALQNVGRVCRYAIATGRAKHDPTFKMSEALKPKRTKHYTALSSHDLPAFMAALRGNRARLFVHTQYATELLLLTFVRTGELIGATWDEFDLEAAEWIVPAERMKMRRPHVVPLSKRAVALLSELERIAAGRPFVFPHYSNPQRHLSNNTILQAIDRLGFKGKTTGHGFRALAMSTIKERLNYRHEVIDRQLAHQPVSKNDRAYDRAAFLAERRKMMQDWADYLDVCLAKAGEAA